nr:T9SS type A sorting domain-containing protein [uncultured Flavobacterium sp.]
MKRILPLAFIFIGISSFAQISLSRHNGTPITDGQIVAFNTIAFPAAEMDFYVRNLSATTTTNVKISCEALVNNDGTGFELCFGNECLSYVEAGEVYPSIPVVLAPNGMNGEFDHLLNTSAGSGTFPKDYVFRFYQINSSGAEFSNSITMTYRYDPSLSTNDIHQLETSGVIVKSTLVENELTLDVLTPSQMTLFDITGKLVNQTKLAYGIQTVDVSNLSQGVYVLKFTSAEGKVATQKIIKN